MKGYQAGDLTKEKIYFKAHEVFYEYGYNNASMKEVCKRAGINQSVFYYHYKDKSELAKSIYADFGQHHSNRILQEIINNQYSADVIISHCTCTALLLLNSLEDPKVGRFWAEMYANNLTSNIFFARHFNERTYKKRYGNFDEIDFEFFLLNTSTINCALILSYLDNRLKTEPNEIARFKTKHTLKALNFSEFDINRIADNVQEITDKIPIKAGKNFTVTLGDEIVYKRQRPEPV